MTIRINNVEIQYEIHRKKVKNMTLRIKSDGKVIVTANNRISSIHIEEFIKNKANWILTKLEKVKNTIKLGKDMLNIKENESILILGKECKLKLFQSEVNKVEIFENNIYIYCKDILEEANINHAFNSWLKKYTKSIMEEQLKSSMKTFKAYLIENGYSNYNEELPVLRIRGMKSRWGSCMVNKRVITLNAYLIHTPLSCIEFVMFHELVHLIHPNHSKDFYYVLSMLLPEHLERNKHLNQYTLI